MIDDYINEEQLRCLLQDIYLLLKDEPDGLSEYELIKRLQSMGYFSFLNEGSANSPHQLFCAHFLLFHLLYRLRDQLHGDMQASLEIGPMRIALDAYQPGDSGVMALDPLRSYYLDLEQLVNTTEEDVESLLSSFWIKSDAYGDRDEALEVLGLSEPVSDKVIKQAYRRLVMTHHPDRGGDKEYLQRLNWAVEILL